MGQILSIPFFIPDAVAVPAVLSKKQRKRRAKKEKQKEKEKKKWNSILASIWNLFGRNPIEKVIGQDTQRTNVTRSTSTNEGMEGEREEVNVQQTKENNDEKTTSTNEGMEAEREKVIGQDTEKTNVTRPTSTNEGMEGEQQEQTKENNDEKTTSTNEGMEAECEKVAKFYAENHNHIVCEHGRDKYTPVMSFIAGKDKFKTVVVPGTKARPGKKACRSGKKARPGKEAQIKVTKEVVRRLLIGIFVRFRLLHTEGKMLNGCFTADNICVPIYKKDQDIFMAPYIEVKLDRLDPDLIKPYTDEGGGGGGGDDKDLMEVGSMLENDIFSKQTDLPADLKKLLELLRSDPIKNKNLIYNHVSLMSPRDQVSCYQWLYKRLMYLKKWERGKYNSIMQKLNITEDWRQKADENRFLAKLNPLRGYSKDGKGLSRFYRNSVEHLFKLFEEDCERGSTSLVEEEKLEDYHIVYILAEAFPDFLADLQKAFHEEGELETFNREDST
ncbi:unnamed protein product [Urochloa decumbens]|uniref:Uncharacterized protein n=1 Tax=Urochloa decumbens TaxID=240449 RepID=A0ABC8YPA9_9POAL